MKITSLILLTFLIISCNSSQTSNAQNQSLQIDLNPKDSAIPLEELLAFYGANMTDIKCPYGFNQSSSREFSATYYDTIKCKGSNGEITFVNSFYPYSKVASTVVVGYANKGKICNSDNLKSFFSIQKMNLIEKSTDKKLVYVIMTEGNRFEPTVGFSCDLKTNELHTMILSPTSGLENYDPIMEKDLPLSLYIHQQEWYTSCVNQLKGKSDSEIVAMILISHKQTFDPERKPMHKIAKDISLSPVLRNDPVYKSLIEGFTVENTKIALELAKKDRHSINFCKTLKELQK